jgi:shikimate dehydrogenase
MRPGAVVTDIVYAPLMTPFLKEAKAQGLPIVDGLGMLLHQAVPGFERWFGLRPDVTEEVRDLVIADLESRH